MKSSTKELILYIIFGGLTTVVNIAVFYFLTLLGMEYLLANVIAWIISVVFAFLTNKLYVFNSKSFSFKLFLREAILFFMARGFSLAVDMVGMVILIELIHMDSLIAKIIVNIIVIVLNYILSKFLIFSKKEKKTD